MVKYFDFLQCLVQLMEAAPEFQRDLFSYSEFPVPIFSKTAPDLAFGYLLFLGPLQQKITLVHPAIFSA